MSDEIARYPKYVQHPTETEISKDVNNNYNKPVPKMVIVNSEQEETELLGFEVKPVKKSSKKSEGWDN